MTTPLFRVRDLSFGHADVRVFDRWSADICAGVTWVVGDEASGKTTLLRCLAAGAAVRAGDDSADTAETTAADPIGIAWCDPHDGRLDPVTVTGHFDRLRRACRDFDDAALARHVDGFALAPHLGKAFFQLSTGTRRKAALAGSLASKAGLTLLDEPTAALDGPSVLHLMDTLAAAAAEARRACVVTGYEVPAGWRCPQVIGLHRPA